MGEVASKKGLLQMSTLLESNSSVEDDAGANPLRLTTLSQSNSFVEDDLESLRIRDSQGDPLIHLAAPSICRALSAMRGTLMQVAPAAIIRSAQHEDVTMNVGVREPRRSSGKETKLRLLLAVLSPLKFSTDGKVVLDVSVVENLFGSQLALLWRRMGFSPAPVNDELDNDDDDTAVFSPSYPRQIRTSAFEQSQETVKSMEKVMVTQKGRAAAILATLAILCDLIDAVMMVVPGPSVAVNFTGTLLSPLRNDDGDDLDCRAVVVDLRSCQVAVESLGRVRNDYRLVAVITTPAMLTGEAEFKYSEYTVRLARDEDAAISSVTIAAIYAPCCGFAARRVKKTEAECSPHFASICDTVTAALLCEAPRGLRLMMLNRVERASRLMPGNFVAWLLRAFLTAEYELADDPRRPCRCLERYFETMTSARRNVATAASSEVSALELLWGAGTDELLWSSLQQCHREVFTATKGFSANAMAKLLRSAKRGPEESWRNDPSSRTTITTERSQSDLATRRNSDALAGRLLQRYINLNPTLSTEACRLLIDVFATDLKESTAVLSLSKIWIRLPLTTHHVTPSMNLGIEYSPWVPSEVAKEKENDDWCHVEPSTLLPDELSRFAELRPTALTSAVCLDRRSVGHDTILNPNTDPRVDSNELPVPRTYAFQVHLTTESAFVSEQPLNGHFVEDFGSLFHWVIVVGLHDILTQVMAAEIFGYQSQQGYSVFHYAAMFSPGRRSTTCCLYCPQRKCAKLGTA